MRNNYCTLSESNFENYLIIISILGTRVADMVERTLVGVGVTGFITGITASIKTNASM